VKSDDREQAKKGGELSERLKGVRKRKKAQSHAACQGMALKRRLAKTKGQLGQ
jgi:hypothetical protein